MSEVQENTEAKLAAYIDGELEGPERAEIEKLLEQHPNYRRVLDQLRVARDLLRGLPRESAPPELCEAFNGQLERTVLLEGLGEKRRGGAAAHRWPQYAAIAAILLLTAGLGIVVSFVLPKGKPAVKIADNRPNPSPSVQPQTMATFSENERDSTEDTNTLARNDRLSAAPMFRGAFGGAGGAGPTTNPAPTVSTPELLAENVYQNPQVQDLLNNGVAEPQRRSNRDRNAATGQDALVVLVRSDDPQQVHKDLAAYCQANSINWEAAPPRVQSAVNFSLNNSVQTNASLQSVDNVRGLAKSATTYPSINAGQQNSLQESVESQKRLELKNTVADVSLIENVYVARNLSRRQAQDLSSALERNAEAHSKEQPTTRAAGNENSPAEAMAPLQTGQQPAQQSMPQSNNAIHRQQFSYWQTRGQATSDKAAAEVELNQLKNEQLKAADTQPTSQLSDQKQSEAGQRNREMRASQQYSASAMPGAQAQSQAQNATLGAKESSATAPTTEPAPDEPVDVLIVVQRTTDASPTTQPATTQPTNPQ